jgi:integrase/recombinase XerD
MLSVYTRHHPDCKNAGDKTWRRCNCPKWIWGSVNGNFIRRSARTHLWEKAEELRLGLLQGLAQPTQPVLRPLQPFGPVVAETGLALQLSCVQPPLVGEILPPPLKRPRVLIKEAVEAHLADAVSRNVSEATLDKLTTIFEKQFLPWTLAQGFEYIDEIELDALLNFRSTWKDGALAKQKKQSRIAGRRNAIEMLMACNREIYFSCPIVPKLADRLRALFAHVLLGHVQLRSRAQANPRKNHGWRV